jgi:hypothetical protein
MLPFGLLSFHEYCQVICIYSILQPDLPAHLCEDEPASLLPPICRCVQLETKVYMTYP